MTEHSQVGGSFRRELSIFRKSVLIPNGNSRNGRRCLEHSRSLPSQTLFKASCVTLLYFRRPLHHLPEAGRLPPFHNLIAALRRQSVTCVNSSSILLLSVFDAVAYLSLTAWAYSIILRRVTTTSFGNTNFDATTTFSVTIIVSQCVRQAKEARLLGASFFCWLRTIAAG